MAEKTRRKFGNLDEALTAGTGMDKDQRQAWRDKLDALMDRRKTLTPGSKEGKAVAAQILHIVMGGE